MRQLIVMWTIGLASVASAGTESALQSFGCANGVIDIPSNGNSLASDEAGNRCSGLFGSNRGLGPQWGPFMPGRGNTKKGPL